MIADAADGSAGRNKALLAIGVGGLVAGTLDLLQACLLFGWRVPLGIAAGLLGPQALQGGPAIYALGILLHFFIATSAATTYYLASRRLRFLTEYALVCGFFFGMTVDMVMRLIVLPLSALHARGPFTIQNEILGLLVHGFLVGVPIAYSIRRFAR